MSGPEIIIKLAIYNNIVVYIYNNTVSIELGITTYCVMIHEYSLLGISKSLFYLFFSGRREKKMKAKKKSPVTPEVKERITALLELDYKFYNHTRERFHQLKRTLGIE